MKWDKTPRLVPCSKDFGRNFMVVSWVEGKRSRKYFATKAEAKRALALALDAARRMPRDEGPVTAEEAEAVRIARRAGLDLLGEVRELVERRAKLEAGAKLGVVVEGKLASLEREGKSAAHRRTTRYFLHRAVSWWGAERNVESISAEECGAFLFGQGWGAVSVRQYRTLLGALFGFAGAHGLCSRNPVLAVGAPKRPSGGIRILEVEQARDLLMACDRAILPGVLFMLFAGLRPEGEAMRLDWKSVLWDRGLIEVTAGTAKTAMRRLVTMQPVLRAWLEWWAGGEAMPKEGNVWPSLSTGRRRWREARAACGWGEGIPRGEWPKDVLRHSFGSYLLASSGDAAGTALQMGHSSTKMLFSNYREVVGPEEAGRFWEMLPPVGR